MGHELELETHEMREQLDQLREEQERGERSAGWITQVALAAGMMAVLAAVAAQQSASLSSEALLLSNRSVLAQAKASDTWNEYQADSVKSKVYGTQAIALSGSSQQAQQLNDQAKAEADKQPALMKEAQRLEAERDSLLDESQAKNAVHETFARSVGALQIGIALASISALTRRRAVFWLGSAFGLAGAAFLGWGFAGGAF
jgi:hypothetical protein